MKRNFDSKPYSYYARLAMEKLDSKIRIKLEKKHQITNSIGFDEFMFTISKDIFSKLTIDKNGIYYKTKMNNSGAPIIISQARLIITICDGYLLDDFYFRDKYLVIELASFLIAQKQSNGLFLFNKSSWMRQDEGVASVFAGIALIKAYELISDEKYLIEALHIWESMYERLYSKELGLIHTSGHTWWTLNVSVLYAYFGSIILKYSNNKNVKVSVDQSLNLILSNMASDGHFPYNTKWTNVYILLYHSHVMYFLKNIEKSEFIEESDRLNIHISLKKAKKYLMDQMDHNMMFVESVRQDYYSYIISNVISLAALKDDLSSDELIIIRNNIAKYYSAKRLHLFIDNDNRLMNKDLYKYNDVLLTEVLYWIVQYIK
jgi:hypothetical protein